MSDLKILKTLQDKSNVIPDFTETMGSFIDKDIIMSRKESQGGVTNEILGPQGSGKTSLMLSYACRIMEENPDELIIWKDSYQSQCQFNRLKNYELFAEIGVDLKFRNIYTDSYVDMPINYFDNYEQLLKRMSPQQLNVVYVKDEIVGYIKLLNYLRRHSGWQSVFIDEYKDIAPLNESGVRHRLIGALGKEMSVIRKGLVSLFCNTQSKSQIDWRVRSGFMINTYLSGAKKDSNSSVYQNAINGLDKGCAWVSWEGKFGRINYPPFVPKKPILDVDDVNRSSDIERILSEL
jgi:hypothetical protein